MNAHYSSMHNMSARGIYKYCGTSGVLIWRRNENDHIIRSQASLNRMRDDIVNHPYVMAI
jgi:hypothetical protein